MNRHWPIAIALIAALAGMGSAPAAARPNALVVTQEHTYRAGVLLIVDAIVQNVSAEPVDWSEASVEFYNFFDELLRVEHAVLQPPTLMPGQKASLRAATPYSDDVRKVLLRFTWRQLGKQFQNRPSRVGRSE